jgi:hypothetical protein
MTRPGPNPIPPEAAASTVVAPNTLAVLEPSTPEEWLKVLCRRMDHRRLGVLMTKSYCDGNAPLPEMSRETKQSWAAFQRRARTNWGELIIDSVVDRIKPLGVTIGGDNQTAKAKQCQQIWRDNRMNSIFKEWLRYGLTFGQSYLTVWKRNGKQTIITSDSPETMIVVTDPLQHWKPIAAMKVWRNIDQARDYAMVWTEGRYQQFTRPTYNRIELRVIPSKWLLNLAEGAWTPVNDGMTSEGPTPIPVVVYNNPGGHGDYESHLDLINRINAGILERLVIQALTAWRQRAITGGLLPELDVNGNRIDYEKVFQFAPGALWNLPEGLDLWESAQTDLSSLLSSSKEDIRQLSAVTKTPLPMLMPDNSNTSAEGAKATEAGYLFRCMDRLDEAKFGVESCLDMAFLVDGGTLDDDEHVEMQFANPQLITLQEKYSAALAAHNSGESWKSIERNILGYSPDQIAQDDLDRAQESLLAATQPPLPTTVMERLTGQVPGTAPAAPTNAPAPNGQQPQPKSLGGAQNAKKVPSTLGGTQPGGRR